MSTLWLKYIDRVLSLVFMVVYKFEIAIAHYCKLIWKLLKCVLAII